MSIDEWWIRSRSAGACAACRSIIVKSTEYNIRCSMLDVRCSTFISFFFQSDWLFFVQRRRSYETTANSKPFGYKLMVCGSGLWPRIPG